jgi:hypothetical protein
MSTWELSFYAVTFFIVPLFYRKKLFVKSVDATPLRTPREYRISHLIMGLHVSGALVFMG